MKKFIEFSLAFVVVLLSILIFTSTAAAEATAQGDQIAHGKYIATIAGCTTCHTPYKADYQNPQNFTLEQIQTLAFDERPAQDTSKFLAGGRAFDLGPAGLVFTLNITPDKETGLGDWTDDQIKQAIKTGVDHEGKILFPVMPYHVFNSMADADVDAVVAYLHSVNAVNNKVPEKTVSTQGLAALPYQTGITAPGASDKAKRGAYLVNSVMACTDCHTPIDPATGAPQMDKYLGGGQPYEGPWGIVYGGNITPDKETGLGDWTEEEIKAALTSGVRKDGRRLILMPWFVYAELTPEDADAVAYYLKNGLPAVRNEVPAASLNQGFSVMAPGAQDQSPAWIDALSSPLVLVVVAVGVILLVSVIAYSVKRKSA